MNRKKVAAILAATAMALGIAVGTGTASLGAYRRAPPARKSGVDFLSAPLSRFGERILCNVNANNYPAVAEFRLTSGRWSALLSTRGASLVELRHGETVVTTSDWAGASKWFSGSTLFPWVNRLADGTWQLGDHSLNADINDAQNNCANHGLVFDREFEATAQKPNSLTLETSLNPDRAYPAPLKLAVNYALNEDGLTVTYDVRNIGDNRAPFAIGGHPYLLAEPDSVLDFKADARIEVDARLLPIASHPTTVGDTHIEVANRKQYTDACFTGLGRDGDLGSGAGIGDEPRRDTRGLARAHLTRPSTNQRVTLWQDAEFTHLQVFTLQTGRSDRPNLVALEPQTAAANALNTGDGLIWLEPGETFIGSWGITIGED